MPASRIQRVQDAVHGLMEFRGMETLVIEVLRTPEVQRLRRVRLGLGSDPLVDRAHKWHVLVGQALLSWPEGDLHKLLEQHERGSSARLGAFLLGRYHVPYLPRLLDSDVDVDRADFLRRDTL